MKRTKIRFSRHLSQISLAVALCAPGIANAAGIGLPEQSTGMIARSFAGATVEATPSTAYYNPAGLVLLQGNQFEGSFNYYDINSRFTGSNDYNGQINGPQTVHGFVESTLVPGSFGVVSLPYGMKLGFSVTTPFGGRVKYPYVSPNGFAGQNQGTEALLTSIQVGLSLAIPITSKLSIGFGPELNYFQNKLGLNENFLPGAPGLLQITAAGGYSGKSYALGYNVGVMYRPTSTTRIGIDYHSRIDQKTKGVERIYPNCSGALCSTTIPLLQSSGLYPPAFSSASDKWTFPQQVSFGIYQKVTPRLAVMASAEWTNWAQQQSLIISDPSTAPYTFGAIYTPFKYRNTWTAGLGFDYSATHRLTVMGGVGFDESPVTTKTRQDLLPDANRKSLSVGFSYKLLPNATLQAGYQHIFVANAPITQTRYGLQPDGSTRSTNSGTLTGNYSLDANVFSTGVTMKF